jgi:hypothetical protein
MGTYPYRSRTPQSLTVCRWAVERRQLEEAGHDRAGGHWRKGVPAMVSCSRQTTPPSGQRPNEGEGVLQVADPRPSYRYLQRLLARAPGLIRNVV